ncbi:MAG TPA: ABC transporter permease [Anaeromyxobacter sp.]|nr:ABC transporter permease [Anaeromyxobacter sp.]
MSTERVRSAPRFRITYQTALLTLMVVLVLVFGLIEPVFFQPDVLFDVTSIVGEIGIMALAMTFIITTGGIDLSVGYILQFAAIVFGVTFTATGSLPLAILLAVLCGAACGLVNGAIIAGTRIPPLVTTLATMNLFRGLSFIIAGTESYAGFPEGFKKLSTTLVFGVVPIQFFYFLALFLIFHLFFVRGSLGRILRGIGYNEPALIFSGLRTKRTLLLIYTLSGVMCGLAALVYLGRLSSAKTSMGNDLNLQVITAVVLGGTSIMGGVGSVAGTFIGVLIIGILRKGFTLLNLSGNIFNFTLGLTLIVALVVFAALEERKKVSGARMRAQVRSAPVGPPDRAAPRGEAGRAPGEISKVQ